MYGAKPTRTKHKDYDFLNTLRAQKYGSIGTTNYPDQYFADAGLTMPDQFSPDAEFIPTCPAMPEGCTNEAQADCATDLTKMRHNPLDLENVTHANARGGLDVRTSIDTARKLGWFMAYYNITAGGVIDWFDSFRVAQVEGVAAGENRSISWGTPWFPSWERALQSGLSTMPMPTIEELRAVGLGLTPLERIIRALGMRSAPELMIPWHNSKLDGWSDLNTYRNKSWQGNQIGDKGFVYFPREVINTIMQIPGTVAFVMTDKPADNPQTVTVSTLEWIVSVLRGIVEKAQK